MSQLFASVNGQRATVASVTLPYYGLWEGDVQLATPQIITGTVTLVLGNLSLTGAMYRGAPFAGVTYLRLVGGAGGWRKSVPAQAYANPSATGVRLSTVLGDVASAVGERVNLQADQTIGNYYIREVGTASGVLRMLAGSEWYVDNAGVTQIGARPSSAITSPFTVVSWDAGKGLFDIATEDYASWLPGNTFTAPTVPTAHTVSMVRHDVGNDGIMRMKVLAS